MFKRKKNGECSDKVVVELDRDLAISLFEWSYQFMTDHNPQFHHPSDAVGIDQLSSELERILKEPFQEDYGELLRLARERAESKYRSRMGDSHSSWLDSLEYRKFSEGE